MRGRVGGFLGAMGFALVGGCTPVGEHSLEDPTRFEAAFAFLEERRVQSMWNDEDCRYIVYDGRALSTTPGSLLCDVVGFPPPRPMDDESADVLDRLTELTDDGGEPLTYAAVWFDETGSVGSGSFFKVGGRCVSYEYAPDWDALPEQEDPTLDPTPVAINEDWYALVGC